MGHKCFISFKTEDVAFKLHIQNELKIDMVDKSLDEAISSTDENYVMQKIREDYLSDSSVTIHLIGGHSAESKGSFEQRFIKRELQASLYNGTSNTRNGILGIVLPAMQPTIYQGSKVCSQCGTMLNLIGINDTSVIKEFSYNYYIPNNKCHHSDDDRYCVLVKWADFCGDPEKYLSIAYDKRTEPIANKVKVRP